MSYILDALRRADAERERGPVPGLHAQPAWAPPVAAGGADAARGGRRGPAYAVGALLVLALIGWLGWRGFETGQGRDPGPIAQAPIAMTPPPMVAAPATPRAPVPEPPATVAEPPVFERPINNAASGKPVDRALRKPATPAAPPPLVGGKGASPTAASTAAQLLPPSAGAASSPPGRVYSVDELPEDIRRELPKLAIGGSIYSESAASRFVIVNGQLHHEGDSVAPGLVLQQIRLKSAVLAFRGYRYTISY